MITRAIQSAGAVAILLLLAYPTHPQGGPCTRRTIAANVVDEKGNPVPGLPAAEFVGKYRGKPVKIVSAEFDQQPRRILVLVDTSGSMQDFFVQNEITRLIQPADLAAPASSRDTYALATFGIKFHDRLSFPQDAQVLREGLKTVQAEVKTGKQEGKGHTAIWDSLRQALAVFGSPIPGDVIYIVTDGGENQSKTRFGDIEKMLIQSGVRVFSLMPVEPTGARPTAEEEEGPRNIGELAKATGGRVLEIPKRGSMIPPTSPPYTSSPKEIKEGLAALFRQVDGYYRVEVDLPTEVDKVRDWELKFADEKAARKKQWELYYQRKLAPCEAAAH